jgi:hypothetical protein
VGDDCDVAQVIALGEGAVCHDAGG